MVLMINSCRAEFGTAGQTIKLQFSKEEWAGLRLISEHRMINCGTQTDDEHKKKGCLGLRGHVFLTFAERNSKQGGSFEYAMMPPCVH